MVCCLGLGWVGLGAMVLGWSEGSVAMCRVLGVWDDVGGLFPLEGL